MWKSPLHVHNLDLSLVLLHRFRFLGHPGSWNQGLAHKSAIEAGLGVDASDGLEMDVVVDDGALIVVVVDNGSLMADLFDRIISWIAVTSVVPWYSRATLRWVSSSPPGFILW